MGRSRHGARTGSTFIGSFGDGPSKADVGGFLADQPSSSGPVDNLAAALDVQQNRRNAELHGQPTRSIAGPLPDMAWDSFFGAMQKKEQSAGDHGLRFKANLAGNGPGEGIGTLGSTQPNGIVDHPLSGLGANPSMEGLQAAANTVNRNARGRAAQSSPQRRF